MYTVAASVHVSALNPYEADSKSSQAFLALARQYQVPLVCPTLLVVELAAAVARIQGAADRAVAPGLRGPRSSRSDTRVPGLRLRRRRR